MERHNILIYIVANINLFCWVRTSPGNIGLTFLAQVVERCMAFKFVYLLWKMRWIEIVKTDVNTCMSETINMDCWSHDLAGQQLEIKQICVMLHNY